MIHWVIGIGLLPLCALSAWTLSKRMFRTVVDQMQEDQARRLFRLRREGLEWTFLKLLARRDPAERVRWDEAHWHDDVHWARERSSHRLLALVEVDLPGSHGVFGADSSDVATALFTFRDGQWGTDARFLADTSPAEAFRRDRRLEPVSPPSDGDAAFE